MISNQILQNTIDGLKVIARVDFCIMDTDGKEAASTTASMSGKRWRLRSPLLIPRKYMDASILKYWMNSNWNTF